VQLIHRLAIAALTATTTLALAGCAGDDEAADKTSESSSVTEDTFDIYGTVEVQAISNGRPGPTCRPDEATAKWPARPGAHRSGVQIGGDVTVTDSSGQVVGLGEVFLGKYIESGYDVSSYCAVPFEVKGVPGGSQFYGVAVAALPKDRYTRDELREPIRIVVPDN
jgi:hypothetical protein